MDIKIDYKKEYKDIYLPKTKPTVIEVPKISYIMIEGKGNPNEEEGEYKEALAVLYALSFTIKMSKMGAVALPGYFEYVVPPLEGLWWSENTLQMDCKQKDSYCWISMIRQPEFVTQEIFEWACQQVREKKGLDTSNAKLVSFQEGLCVQIMHIGSYDEEAISIEKIKAYMEENQLEEDLGTKLEKDMVRRHHEIYLGDPRKVSPEKLKTVIRIPVIKKKQQEVSF